MTPCPTPGLWTVEDTAGYLQVPVATLYVWRSKRTGPRGIRVGKYLRYKPDDVARWLEEQADRDLAA